MSKRFTDTNKWDDEWFLELSPESKLFYGYILDKCDHAGVWKVNFKLANFLTGKKYNKDKILTEFSSRIHVISDEYWLIRKFIDFQYGALSENNNAHKGVLKILNKFNILDYKSLGANEGLISTSAGAQDKDKDKDKEKDKEKEKEKEKPVLFLDEVVDLWNRNVDEFNLPRIKSLNANRKKKLLLACKDFKDIEDWKNIFTIAASKGFTGSDGRMFIPNWDYVFRNDNYMKFYEESQLEKPKQKASELVTEVESMLLKGL